MAKRIYRIDNLDLKSIVKVDPYKEDTSWHEILIQAKDAGIKEFEGFDISEYPVVRQIADWERERY